MAILIDTYNLLFAAAAMKGALSDLSMRRLCQFIVSSPNRVKTTLVIDGRPKPEEPSENEFPDLHLIYSGAGIKADTIIAQLVARSRAPANLTVVSNDRAVANQARSYRAKSISCEAYLNALLTAHSAGAKLARSATRLPTKKTHGSPDPAETNHWLKVFDQPTDPATPKPKKPKTDEDIDTLDMKDLMGF